MRTQINRQKGGEKRRQINMRVEPALYQALEAVAQQEQHSVAQTARQLLAEGLQYRLKSQSVVDDLPSQALATLASQGGAFNWLADEPEIYSDTDGEPL